MGMEYARLYFDFFNCEKTLYLTDMCGEEGIVCLLKLWIRAGVRNNDGVFNKTPRALEKIAGWKGEDGLLIQTLTDTDFPFLDKVEENVFQLHNWEDNNPHLTDLAQKKRSEKARKAGLASAESRKEKATTSQLQVNSESTASQLNPTQGQLGSTNVTKCNVTKGNIIKDIVELPEKNGNYDGVVDAIMTDWKTISGQKRLSLKTESFRKQIRGRIKELIKSDVAYKEPSMLCDAFQFVFNNKKNQADDPEYQRFTTHDWNLTTLTRPSNFMKYLHEPAHTLEEKRHTSLLLTDEEREEYENRNPF